MPLTPLRYIRHRRHIRHIGGSTHAPTHEGARTRGRAKGIPPYERSDRPRPRCRDPTEVQGHKVVIWEKTSVRVVGSNYERLQDDLGGDFSVEPIPYP